MPGISRSYRHAPAGAIDASHAMSSHATFASAHLTRLAPTVHLEYPATGSFVVKPVIVTTRVPRPLCTRMCRHSVGRDAASMAPAALDGVDAAGQVVRTRLHTRHSAHQGSSINCHAFPPSAKHEPQLRARISARHRSGRRSVIQRQFSENSLR